MNLTESVTPGLLGREYTEAALWARVMGRRDQGEEGLAFYKGM